MSKETADLISRLNASRDTLKGLNIGDYALVRQARDVMADAANALDNYARTMDRIAGVDVQWAGVLTWLDERGRNSRSFGSHADAYEIAARRLREALNPAKSGLDDQSGDAIADAARLAPGGPLNPLSKHTTEAK